jgi:hypothetical protein
MDVFKTRAVRYPSPDMPVIVRPELPAISAVSPFNPRLIFELKRMTHMTVTIGSIGTSWCVL